MSEEIIRNLVRCLINENWGGTIDPHHEIIRLKEKVEEFAVEINKKPRTVTRQFMNDLIGKEMRVRPKFTRDLKYKRLLSQAMGLGRRRGDIFKKLYDEFKLGELNIDFIDKI